MRIRIIATFPGKHAIQVVSKYHGKLIIHKHIGTFSNESQYELLGKIYDKLGFSNYGDSLIRDLVIARIYSPSSKRETREVLEDLFNTP